MSPSVLARRGIVATLVALLMITGSVSAQIGCTTEATEALCRCTIEEFQDRLTLVEFIDLVDTDLVDF